MHETADVDGVALELWVAKKAFAFHQASLQQEFVNEPQLLEDVKTAVLSQDYFRLAKEVEAKGGKLQFALNGRPTELVVGKQLFLSAHDLAKHSQKQ